MNATAGTFGIILTISLGVAMDAAAVSAARAATTSTSKRVRDVIALPIVFGVFQCVMPLLGWLLGSTASAWVAAFDHWVAFALLSVVGGKMLWEARKGAEAATEVAAPLTIATVLALGVATSIDAFAIGVTLPLIELPLAISIASIGVVTFAVSLVASVVARRVGAAFGKRLEVAGGVILIAIGVKTLLEHLVAQ